MDRLSLVLCPVTGAVLTGSLATAIMSLGHYGWGALYGAALAGTILAWPAAFWVSRRIKRADPFFDHTRLGRAKIIPHWNDPEV